MVIGDYHIETVFARPFDRPEAANAAIDTDNERKPVLLGLLKCRDVDAVAFGKAIWYVKPCFYAEQLQRLAQKRRPRGAVDIVISPNKHLFMIFGGTQNSVHSGLQAF